MDYMLNNNILITKLKSMKENNNSNQVGCTPSVQCRDVPCGSYCDQYGTCLPVCCNFNEYYAKPF
jgi:hypothetical protein